MTNLTPLSSFDDVIQHETATLVLGGVGGPMNTQAQQLLNRTQFLNNARVALSDATDSSKGAAVIGRAGQVVDSITLLRGLLKTSVSTHAFVTGYYAAGDGGGGPYYLDVADVVSADNGGTIIVATDGGRWKLIHNDVVSVKQFGAKGDGVTDDAPAVRRALDIMPARGGTVIYPDVGPYLQSSVVYIPQRISVFSGPGIKIIGNNTSIIGSGSNNIFESGTGTMSTGGASNFGQPNESNTSIHYNSSIEGFNFSNCGIAVRLFNWIQGCTLKKLYGTNFTTMIDTTRCFYLGLEDVQGRPLQDARAATTPIFRFFDSNNTMTFVNVHCSGITAGSVQKGVGWEFDGGVQGIVLPAGCSSEGCVQGVVLKSIIYSMAITGFYMEANLTAVKSIGANLLNLVMDYNEFEDNGVDVDVDGWVDGYFGAANRTENSVTFGNGCTHEVQVPAQTLSDATHTTWVRFPPGWTVPGGCKVTRNDEIYNSATGFQAVWFRNDANSSGATGVVPKSYTGDSFNVGGIIPYCVVAGVGGTSLTVDTKIVWSPDLAAVRFDIFVEHSSTSVVAGTLSAKNTVFRDDATAFTVVTSNNGGFLRFTFGGFGTITSFGGQIRII